MGLGCFVELLQQHESDVWFKVSQCDPNRCQIIVDAEGQNGVTKTSQGLANIEFRLPGIHFLFTNALERLWRDQRLMHQHQDSQPFHETTFTRHPRPDRAQATRQYIPLRTSGRFRETEYPLPAAIGVPAFPVSRPSSGTSILLHPDGRTPILPRPTRMWGQPTAGKPRWSIPWVAPGKLGPGAPVPATSGQVRSPGGILHPAATDCRANSIRAPTSRRDGPFADS